ncbi:MBL fold metallo-hydrolase [Sporolactobacillus nakayamae]|uniref:Glyoxylase, beta-lactamase superfamily II n=1 Tax=Sporolactobacillus nakayamae TaxID=269670 RepID=A0A1I2T4M6_9BACL|nr:MBL fold metallo-hydrolase [Sporolactobacillus nakayamae]SFG59770.1 Glyoxylase, beta-lactamase superfamily II [Sporolactobacillus nakayamae]
MTAYKESFPKSNYFSLTPLDDGVWAALSIPGTGSWSNAGIIDIGDQTLIFDAFATPTSADDLRIAAEKLTDRQATLILNSHYHLDHVNGDQIFQDVPIISTKLTREQIANQQPKLIDIFKTNNTELLDQTKAEMEQEKNPEKRQELESLLGEYSMIIRDTERFKLTLPTITFEDKITLNGAKMSAEFITYGGGHTISDAFLYLPKEQILFLADLMHIGYHADIRQGNVDHWIDILKKIKKLKIKKIVSGHGAIGTAKDIDDMINYLYTIKQIAVDWSRHGGTIENINEIQIPPKYVSYGAPSIFHYNIRSLMEKGI